MHDLDTNRPRAFPGRCIQTTWQVATLFYIMIYVNALMLLNPDEVWRVAFCLWYVTIISNKQSIAHWTKFVSNVENQRFSCIIRIIGCDNFYIYGVQYGYRTCIPASLRKSLSSSSRKQSLQPSRCPCIQSDINKLQPGSKIGTVKKDGRYNKKHPLATRDRKRSERNWRRVRHDGSMALNRGRGPWN